MAKKPHYTITQRIFYGLKRMQTAFYAILLGLFLLYIFGDPIWMDDAIKLGMSGILRVGIGFLFLSLISKFVFPSINLQNELNAANIAVGVFMGCLAIAIALLV